MIENKENPEFVKFSKEEEKSEYDLEQEKGLFQTTNSRVYLLEPLNPHFLNQDLIDRIQYLILRENIKIGLNQMYQDFNLFSPRKSR